MHRLDTIARGRTESAFAGLSARRWEGRRRAREVERGLSSESATGAMQTAGRLLTLRVPGSGGRGTAVKRDAASTADGRAAPVDVRDAGAPARESKGTRA